MPFPSGSKKPNKSYAAPGTFSWKTSKGPKPSVSKKAKKEHVQAQSGAQKNDEPDRGYAERILEALDPKFTAESQKIPPDVFEYMEDYSSTDDGSLPEEEDVSAPSDQASEVPKIRPRLAHLRSNADRRTNTMPHSQAGRRASIRSKSPVKPKGSANARQFPQVDVSPTTRYRKVSCETMYSMPGALTDNPAPSDSLDLDPTILPETYYFPRNPTSIDQSPLPPSPPQSPKEDPNLTSKRSRQNTKTTHIPSGYGILSNQLSSPPDSKEPPRVPPLYRRFEDLNHRVLLYLQDEIAQMEEDLRVLDEQEEIHRIDTAEREGTKKMPASRRMDQAQVSSPLYHRRIEMMGALVHKTEKYNNALAAYSKVLQTIPRATDKDIETYRTWMKENSPIILAESRFLDHGNDLVSLAPRRASHLPPVYSPIIIASAAILFPLLAFSTIAEFAGRLLVVALVGGAASTFTTNYSPGAELIESRDGWRSAVLYFGFMTLAAVFIP